MSETLLSKVDADIQKVKNQIAFLNQVKEWHTHEENAFLPLSSLPSPLPSVELPYRHLTCKGAAIQVLQKAVGHMTTRMIADAIRAGGYTSRCANQDHYYCSVNQCLRQHPKLFRKYHKHYWKLLQANSLEAM